MSDKKPSKTEVRKCYNKLHKLALAHMEAERTFDQLCEKYYGFKFNDSEELIDDDDIIDTLDYGIGALSFDDFHKKMLSIVI
jgi:hypothetical protein